MAPAQGQVPFVLEIAQGGERPVVECATVQARQRRPERALVLDPGRRRARLLLEAVEVAREEAQRQVAAREIGPPIELHVDAARLDRRGVRVAHVGRVELAVVRVARHLQARRSVRTQSRVEGRREALKHHVGHTLRRDQVIDRDVPIVDRQRNPILELQHDTEGIGVCRLVVEQRIADRVRQREAAKLRLRAQVSVVRGRADDAHLLLADGAHAGRARIHGIGAVARGH